MKYAAKVLCATAMAIFLIAATASVSVAATFTSTQHTVTTKTTQTSGWTLAILGFDIINSCKTVTEHSHVTNATSVESMTARPTLKECQSSLGTETKVTGFGAFGEEKTCDFLYSASGTLNLVCQAGAEVTIESGTCTVHIPGQTGLGTVSYSNTGSGGITVSYNISNIQGTRTDGFLCPFEGSGSFTNGVLAGTSLLTGEDPSTHEAVNMSWDK